MAEYLLFHVFLLLVTSLVTVSANDVVYTTAGETAELPCEGPEGRVVALQWETSKRRILVYRGGRVEETQDEQFRNRVQLQNLESGKLDLSLKNVTVEDSGNYTCKGLVQTSKRQKRAVVGEDFSRSIQLIVRPKEKTPQKQPHTAVNEEKATHTDSGGAADPHRSHVTAAIVPIVVLSFVIPAVVIPYLKRKEIKLWQRVEQPHTMA